MMSVEVWPHLGCDDMSDSSPKLPICEGIPDNKAWQPPIKSRRFALPAGWYPGANSLTSRPIATNSLLREGGITFMRTARQTPVERRKCARLDIALSVSYVVRDADGEVTAIAEAMSSDISATGIRLMTPTPLRNGSTLDLEITIEGQESEPVFASCEVVWQNQISETSYEVGAVIRHIEEEDKRRFLEFVFDQMAQLVGMTSRELH